MKTTKFKRLSEIVTKKYCSSNVSQSMLHPVLTGLQITLRQFHRKKAVLWHMIQVSLGHHMAPNEARKIHFLFLIYRAKFVDTLFVGTLEVVYNVQWGLTFDDLNYIVVRICAIVRLAEALLIILYKYFKLPQTVRRSKKGIQCCYFVEEWELSFYISSRNDDMNNQY